MADATARLGKLFRLILGGQTEGEQLAAVAAFRRAMEAAGLDLHAAADMLRPGRDPAHAPPWESDDPGAEAEIRRQPGFSVAWEAATRLAQTVDDDVWPAAAAWLVKEDDAWYAGHGRGAGAREVATPGPRHRVAPTPATQRIECSDRLCAVPCCVRVGGEISRFNPHISARHRMS